MLDHDNAPSHRLSLPDWIADRIRMTNYTIVDYMYLGLRGRQSLSTIFRVTLENLSRFKEATPAKDTLLNAPFLIIDPVLTTAIEWTALLAGKPTTTIDALNAQMPAIDDLAKFNVYHQNTKYVSLLTDILNLSLLAAPICGLSLEVAQLLRDVPTHALEHAISRTKFPLFRWRFNSPAFWFDVSQGHLNEDCLAHYLMMRSPMRADALQGNARWATNRFDRLQNEIYGDLFLRLGARASTVSSLFFLNQTTTRPAFKRHHGVSSPMGKLPTSPSWHVLNARFRVQSTAFIWLYRSALAAGGNVADANIASMALCKLHFGNTFELSFDRACNLSKSMSADSTLSVVPCRSCKTPYIISNTQSNVELAHSFNCPVCTNKLFSGRGGARQRDGVRKISNTDE
jgi:hypothetical protein